MNCSATVRKVLLLGVGFILNVSAMAANLTVIAVDERAAVVDNVALALLPLNGPVPAGPKTAEIGQENKTFIPLVSVVQTGTAISFPNRDTVRHHVYSFSPAKTFELKLYAGTPAKPVTFNEPGLVVLGCNIHDHMVAYVMVANTPWQAVTDAQGRAEFKDVPAGEYDLQYWHPRWAGRTELPRVRVNLERDGRMRLVITDKP